MTCPDHDQIVDYVDGALPAARVALMERHVIACQGCRLQIAAERELIERMRGLPTQPLARGDFMAGLMSVAGPTPSTISRPIPTKVPATLSCHAPAQYVSVRRSLGFAALAVAGCLSVAVVAANVPTTDTVQTRTPTLRTVDASPENPVPVTTQVTGFRAGSRP
ncbi:anti-sigma factor family protein [Calidifontibacter terrae]